MAFSESAQSIAVYLWCIIFICHEQKNLCLNGHLPCNVVLYCLFHTVTYQYCGVYIVIISKKKKYLIQLPNDANEKTNLH